MVLVDDAPRPRVVLGKKRARARRSTRAFSSRANHPDHHVEQGILAFYGGAVLGPAELKARIIEGSRLFIGSTPFAAASGFCGHEVPVDFERRPAVPGYAVPQCPLCPGKAARGAGLPSKKTPGPIIAVVPAGREGGKSFENSGCSLARFIHHSSGIPAGRKTAIFDSSFPASTAKNNWTLWQMRCFLSGVTAFPTQ